MLTRAALMLALSQGGVLSHLDGPRPTLAPELAQDQGGTPPLIAPDSQAAAVPDGPLPRCTALPENAAGMADCNLDQSGTLLTFEFSRDSTGDTDAARMTLTQSAPEGGERLISDPIRVTGVTLAPRLTDLDGDGSFELFVPVGRAGSETIFELWLPDETYFFARADEVIAPSPDAIEARDGLLILTVPDADAPGQTTETAMFLDPTGLTELYRLAIDSTAGTCTVLAETGATLNAGLIEAECADRLGFAAPGAATSAPDILTETPAPDISPKSL